MAHWHATILAKVCRKRDSGPATILSVLHFHHQLQSCCRMSWVAFVCDLAEGIAFVVVVAAVTYDAVMSKLFPYLSHTYRNYSIDFLKVAADMNHRMDGVTLTKEYLNKVDVIDFSVTILYRA